MPIGSVARFDCRRGYGFVIPDDGGEDIFVHQNNIEMEGFRFLQPGERVNYELEVGEKGMKAVGVALVEPRPVSENRQEEEGDYQDGGERRPQRSNRKSSNRKNSGGNNGNANASNAAASESNEKLQREVEKLRRKQERLLSLLVEKGVLQAGEIDGPVAELATDTAADLVSDVAEA